MNLDKLKEAEEWRLKATKMLKTSIFGNWQPDYLSAAPYFDKAAALYKAAGAEEQSKNAYVKSAECNEKTSTYAAAAMAYKNASQMAKEDEDEEGAAELLAREAEMWVLQGDSGRAADSLVRAGVMVEDSSPSKAVDYCMQAIELLMPHGRDPLELAKAPLANDVFSKALNLCLRNEKISNALKVCGKAAGVLAAQGLNSSLYKMYCTQTILQLYLGDVVAAGKTFMEVHLQHSGYLRAPECECAENLLTAAKAMDGEGLVEAVRKLSRAYLDNNVIRIARRLNVDRISGGLGGEDEEEDEDEGEEGARFVRTLPQDLGPGPSMSPSGGAASPTRPVSPPLPSSSAQPSWMNASSPSSSSPTAAAAAGKKPASPMGSSNPFGSPVAAKPQPSSSSSSSLFEKRKPTPSSPTPPPPPPPAVAVKEEEAARLPSLSSSSQDGGLMDLSDLQAGLEEEGEEEDDDLDVAIREAKAMAHQASGEGPTKAAAAAVATAAPAVSAAAAAAAAAPAKAVSAAINPFADEDEVEVEEGKEAGKMGGVVGVEEVEEEEEDFDLR